jgi:hypothetical protein
MNRLWVGIRDIIGMRWFRGRFIPPNRAAGDARPQVSAPEPDSVAGSLRG